MAMFTCKAVASVIVISIMSIISISATRMDSIAQATHPNVGRVPLRIIPSTPQFVQGEVLVKYRSTGARLGAPSRTTVVSSFPKLGIQRLKLRQGESVADAIGRLERLPDVERVTPNYKIYPLMHPQPQLTPPMDTEWTEGWLWGLAKIGMKDVWDPAKGNITGHNNIVIAVIDTGIDYNHPDLQANRWVNPAPTFGDIHGANFCNRKTTGDPTEDPMDDDGHGTLVAGTIAAVGSTGSTGNSMTSLVGVNWNAKLMAVKFMCVNQANVLEGSVGDAIAAIQYAVDNRATILNASWRVASNVSSGTLTGLEEAVKYANGQNPNNHRALFVAAAGHSTNGIGNNNDINPVYPANFPEGNVIAVAATDHMDLMWNNTVTGEHTNWGSTTVHIAAPGVDIDSTFPTKLGPTPSTTDGTSMAAPHVAGCAAIVQAKRKMLGIPLMDPNGLKGLLMNNGTNIPSLNGKVVNGRRLNCFNAINAAGGDTAAPASPMNLRVQ